MRGNSTSCFHATMTTGTVEPTISSRSEKFCSPFSETLFKTKLCSGCAARLKYPIERQRNGDDDEEQKPKDLYTLKTRSFENLIVVVGLTVCSKFLFGTDFAT